MFSDTQDTKLIAFVVYPGVTMLDLVATATMLKRLAMGSRYRTVVVGERTGATDSDTPLKLIPPRSFAEVPHPFGVIVPGGGLNTIRAMGNEELLTYVRAAAETAELVGSVGTGALLLAAAGLLQGRQATTHWAYARILENLGAHYVPRRWVEDGKVITSAGTSGGIDMALSLVAKQKNHPAARHIQLLAEYDPQPPFGGIAWGGVDRDALSPILAAHDAEVKQVLAHRPQLLTAVLGQADTAALSRQETDHLLPERQTEKTIAFVLYPGLTVFDLVGPLQVLSQLAALRPEIRPVVVGERMAPMVTDIGVPMVPDATFDEVLRPFAFVVPGGGLPTIRALSNAAIRHYVRTAAETAEIVGSVCTGALILAAVGLLEGRQATTHWAYYKLLESFGARYQRKRWVEDGKFIMSAGVSAGIDMGLYLAARLTDEATARRVQLWLDYDPQPPFGRIDWSHLDPFARAIRAGLSLAAPVLTARPRRLMRRERAA